MKSRKHHLCKIYFVFFIFNLFGAPVAKSFAEGFTIDGKITILDHSGKPKSDHSNVIVFLDEMQNAPPNAPESHAVMTQANKQFAPKFLPIVAGTTVDFPNEDTVFHNVFSLSKAQPFDLGIYPQKASKSLTFDQPGLVKVYCNIHPQMIGYVLVLANPYFTTTDADGHFKLSNVPVGPAKLRTWYYAAHNLPEKEIQVTEKGIADINLSIIESLNLNIQEEIISVKHPNKWGQDYQDKY